LFNVEVDITQLQTYNVLSGTLDPTISYDNSIIYYCLCVCVCVCVCVVVLALAYGSSIEDLIFVGMVGLLDPPRDGIQDAVLTLLSTGAHLKMVTGDAEETALAIGNIISH